MKNNNKSTLLILILSIALLIVFVILVSQISIARRDYHSTSKFPVQIQEYMSSNSLYPNEQGVCTDWVELYNSSDSEINISGFKLTDESSKPRYTIPAGTVLPGHGYYVIYCLRSGDDTYADFGIARNGGEDILLLNRKNVLVDSIKTISLPENASAERDETGAFRVSTQPSPGGPSNAEILKDTNNPEDILKTVSSSVLISEVISGNTLFSDENGFVADIVELVNISDLPVDIGGYCLQDDVNGNQFTCSSGTVIEPHGYYCIYCARAQNGTEYADFALSRNGGELLLLYTKSGELADYITTRTCGKNESTARINDSVITVWHATPGYANTDEGYYSCMESFSSSSPVRISEIMAFNAGFLYRNEDSPDWIELHNVSDKDVDISGYGLSDNLSTVRYTIPEGTILPAGGNTVIFCSSNPGVSEDTARFGISSKGGETVLLTKRDGTLSCCAVTIPSEENTSLVYNDGIIPTVSIQPTPGFSNDAEGIAAYLGTRPSIASGLVISEIMPCNACTFASGDGFFPDWVELHNIGVEDVNLNAFCLSDRESDLSRFLLPDRILKPDEYILILCNKDLSGSQNEIWAPFGLSSKGGAVYLSSRDGILIETAAYPAADDDRSFTASEEGSFLETDYPTPGLANTGAGYWESLLSWVPNSLYISEVMPSNRSVARTNGEYYDWIELCNGGTESINLGAFYLTDDNQIANKFKLPDITLEGGERVLIYCSGDISLSDAVSYHCPFKLNSGEDHVYLYSSDAKLVDYLHIYNVPSGGTIGRQDRTGGVFVYDTPSPGEKNKNGTEALQLSTMPLSDQSSGIYDNCNGFFITLSAPGDVFYTTDGSEPTSSSKRYTDPIYITKTSVLRAAALEDEKRFSKVLTLAFTLNEGHNLPVLNLVLDPNDFSGKKGIYSHPKETWQRDASIVYADANGIITHDCGIRISGQHSRTRPQKSFKLIFSDQYGGRLRYDIFGDSCEQKSFPELLVRAGLDSKYGIYREPLIQQMAMPYRDTTFVQDSVPCVVYINGTYYGIYQFMESLCEDTFADRLDVRTDSITMYKGYLYPEHKHLEIYQLLQYVKEHDMSNSECYEYAKAHLDLDNLIDWAIFQAYCKNTDISGNVRYFMSSETDGRWHFAFYDVECGFKQSAGIEYVLSIGQTADFLTALLHNGEFKDMFLRRFAYHCDNTFQQEKVLALLHEYDSAVRPETERHFLRWGLKPITYVYNYNQMERLLEADRVAEMKRSVKLKLDLSDAEYQFYFG